MRLVGRDQKEEEMEASLEMTPCMICKLIKDKLPDYKMDEPKNVWLIKPIRDGALNRLIGRDQSIVYTVCSKHSRMITKLIDEYIYDVIRSKE